MTCKTCMKLRARFLLWLGKKMGVMEDAKPKEVNRMEFTPQQALIKIGAQALELDILAGQLQQALARIKELEGKPDAPSLEVVK